MSHIFFVFEQCSVVVPAKNGIMDAARALLMALEGAVKVNRGAKSLEELAQFDKDSLAFSLVRAIPNATPPRGLPCTHTVQVKTLVPEVEVTVRETDESFPGTEVAKLPLADFINEYCGTNFSVVPVHLGDTQCDQTPVVLCPAERLPDLHSASFHLVERELVSDERDQVVRLIDRLGEELDMQFPEPRDEFGGLHP